jgi:NAD(P)-dependent dehydrogenase (short-subunit alcohol dehydrogenase family)
MRLSARELGSANDVDGGVDLRVGPSEGLRIVDAADGADDGMAAACAEALAHETVVVHVQLRPLRPATRRCLAALAALAARHETVSFALTGLGGDDRLVRVTVGVELGPRELIAKFSEQAQAAYAFVDGLFTDLYDYMPVYVGEPSEAERTAAVGVLAAAQAPAPRVAAPRIPTPRTPPLGQLTAAARRVAVPA